jgi:hypothetical protein
MLGPDWDGGGEVEPLPAEPPPPPHADSATPKNNEQTQSGNLK